MIQQQSCLVDWYEIDKLRVEAEKERDDGLYQSHLQELKETTLILNVGQSPEKQELYAAERELEKTGTKVETKTAVLSNSASNTGVRPDNSNVELMSPIAENSSLKLGSGVNIIVSYINDPRKYEVKDFTNIFISRFRFLENILRNRQELENVINISRILNKNERATVAA